jgi:hypothetical protein
MLTLKQKLDKAKQEGEERIANSRTPYAQVQTELVEAKPKKKKATPKKPVAKKETTKKTTTKKKKDANVTS